MSKFSVLMSLYIKEKPEYFDECMKSVIHQTVLPTEVVIVLDGPITEKLQQRVDYYLEKYPDLIRTVPLKENQGLGKALAIGVPECKYDLIARMDTDDICRDDRFEKQLLEFEKNPDLDICGSHIAEFSETVDKIKGKRLVPLEHEDIVKYQKRRDGFNHVTVMFKKESVLKAGNYQHALLMEDSLLWANMFLNGCIGKNIDDCLVYVRAGDEMIERRGGFSYFLKYKEGRKKILETGFISKFDYYYTLLAQLVVALVPSRARVFIFNNLLRKSN
ncbi:MAG: glycosyltransferase [Erysipelotrichaceae bacterium]|jgi:glycosyltransferase involved in cell wall biosynthesis